MPKKHTPRLCLHKPSGRGYVRLNGRVFYLGPWGAPETQEAYEQKIAEWIVGGRRAPVAKDEVTVVEIAAAFNEWARGYYVHRDGTQTGHAAVVRSAMKGVVRLYGRTPACEFSPSKLLAVRQAWIDAKLARKTINTMTRIVVQGFKWAAEREMVDGSIVVNLRMVSGLRKGRSPAREPEPIGPVPLEDVEAIQPHVNSRVWALVQFQLATGCRPGEAVALRRRDVNDEGDVWEVRLTDHKTAHHGRTRTIFVGPKGQAVLKPFLLRPADAHLFSPREGFAERKPGTVGRRPNQRKNPTKTDRRIGTAYTPATYRRAVEYGCKAAGVTVWKPNQLRHTAATLIRQRFGLEAAQVVLGHAHAAVTEIYAAADAERARRVVAEIG